MRERLGTAPVITAPKSPNSESKPSNEIRIKTLEEIRQEKAAKSQMQCKVVKVVTGAPTNASPSTKRDKPVSGPTIKTFSEILHDKKKLQETKLVPHQGSTSTEKTEGPINTGVIKLTAQSAKIKVKTLEEIRKEKADRMQAKTQDTTNNACTSSDAVPKRRLIRVGKTGGKLVCLCVPPPPPPPHPRSFVELIFIIFYLQKLSTSDLKKCKILRRWIALKRQGPIVLV